MAWIFNGKHFGGYTFDHWFDEDDPGADGEGAEKDPPAEPPPPPEKKKMTDNEASP
jgi:hypothetical protein